MIRTLIAILVAAAFSGGFFVPARAQTFPGTLPPNIQTANYTIAATDCGKNIQAGTGATGFFTVTLPAVAGFATNCAVTVTNGDTGRGKHLAGFPTGALDTLWPGQTMQVNILNGAWAISVNPGRYKAAPTFFVDNSGSDTNDGLGTGAQAFQTVNKCLTVIYTELDLGNSGPTCQLNGTQIFTECLTMSGLPVGYNVIFITGSGGTATLRSCPGGAGPLLMEDYAIVELTSIKLDCFGGGSTCFALFMHQTTIVDFVGSNNILNGNAAGHFGIVCDQICRVNIGSGLTISGLFATVFQGGYGSSFAFNGVLAASGTVTAALLISMQVISDFTFQGSVTFVGVYAAGMKQWSVTGNSVLCNMTGTSIPGTVAGTNADGLVKTSC